MITPIEKIDNIWIKRDDTFNIANAWGGKARSCWALSQKATKGLVTAGSRNSPQINIVAHIARKLNLPFRAHTAIGSLGDEITQAQSIGANIIQHRPGYNNVIIARAKEDSYTTGYTYIPFGMECDEAVQQTASQVRDIPTEVKRIVVPVGSGMSFCGILDGLKQQELNIPVLGIQVGADPLIRLKKYAPRNYQKMSDIIVSKHKYSKHIKQSIGDILLDPIYEAKCYEYLRDDDMLWLVGIRTTKT